MSEIVDLNRCHTARRLGEERTEADALRMSPLQQRFQIVHGRPRVDDVLHNDDVLVFDGKIKIFQNLNLSAGDGRVAIAGDNHKIEVDRAVNGTYKIGEEDGSFDFKLLGERNAKAELLLQSLLLGYQTVQEAYGNSYLMIKDQEV